MPARCTSFIATSLDGFISRPDGAIDWLEAANQLVPAGEDCGYADYLSTVDAIVMGRHTFDLAVTFDPWPYGAMPVYVLSHSLRELPPGAPSTVSLRCCSPAQLASEAAAQGHQRLYVDGGKTIQGFIAAGLLQEITITVIPVLIGEGRPLFGPLPAPLIHLEHQATRSFPFGFVQSRYALR